MNFSRLQTIVIFTIFIVAIHIAPYTYAAPDTIAPSTPGQFQITSLSAITINLSWSASTDNVGVVGYKLYRNNVLISTQVELTFSDTNRTPLTTYSYNVSAIDADRKSVV